MKRGLERHSVAPASIGGRPFLGGALGADWVRMGKAPDGL
ncbi:hypothetical protein [Azospirillum doebereinerae]